MSLLIEPDLYTPIQNKDGIYIDKIPSFYDKPQGLLCPCSVKSQRNYNTSSSFSAHTKTQMHQKWLETVNTNKHNMLIENQQLADTVRKQQMIITDLSNKIEMKTLQINSLLELCTIVTSNGNKLKTDTSVSNLLDIDEHTSS